MFERFTDKARRGLVLAQDEARALGHNFIGTEHILLGLLGVGDSVGSRVLLAEGLTAERVRHLTLEMVGAEPSGLRVDDSEALASIGIDLDSVREAVEESFGEGALERATRSRKRRVSLGAPPFVPRAKKVVELSLREALQMGHNYIGTEHILLGIIREGEGVAAKILVETVGPLDELRAKVIDEVTRLRPGA